YNNPLAEEPDTAYGESYYSRYGNSSRNATTAPVAVVDYRKTPGVAPPAAASSGDDEEIYEYDNEGNIVERAGHKEIDPLPPVDHSQVQYAPFERNFYTPHPEVAAMKPEQAMELRRKLGIRVQGVEAPYPICSFAHLGLDDQLMDSISRAGFTQPTPIQAQACPAALSGRDVIGIAKTGSGKTVTFVWPLVMHVLDQSPLAPGDGPIGLICAPTRELALQIYAEARKFGKPYGVTVVCAYGGGSMWEQQKACEAGCEILVCTPGRLIDLVKKKATNLRRVTYLVFDEADKMFQLGFEAQVRSIANHVRPDRQTLLFSATFKRRVERLVRDILTDPIRICQGELGEANQDVRQFVEIFRQPEDKWIWMQRHLAGFCSQGQTLVFVTRKANSEDVAKRISGAGFSCRLLHGDMHQSERNDTIAAYKRGEFQVLVATDVASRGLDIPAIRTVINYESARDIDTHTHRVGRTGRAGHKGMAYTLLLDKEKDFAGHLVRNLEGVGQEAPPRLLALANECAWFKNSRFKSGGQGKRVSASGRTESGQPGSWQRRRWWWQRRWQR
uniref:RNA helicase n=1 Tax=Macrostomum lignano TaxID=282301 RepID=A0A1I8GU29_9PLAT